MSITCEVIREKMGDYLDEIEKISSKEGLSMNKDLEDLTEHLKNCSKCSNELIERIAFETALGRTLKEILKEA